MSPSLESAHPDSIPAPFADPRAKPRVALVRGLSEGSFMDRYLMGAQAMAVEFGIELVTFDAQGDQADVATLVERARKQRVEAIVINHGQTEALQPAVEAALDQGVPVVTFDTVIDHPDVPEIEQDDMLVGFKLAKKLVTDCAGRANVIYINAEGFAPLEKRDRAWQDYQWRYPNLNQIARMGAVTDQTAADTQAQLQTLLRQHPDTTTVLAMWDEFAKGAFHAINQAGLADQIQLYSVDITDDDIQLMTEPGSPWVATVATDAYNIGRLALRTAVALFAGEKVKKYLLVEPHLISREFLVSNRISHMDQLIQALPTLGESRLVWFDWMEPLLTRNGYRIPAATLPPEQLLIQLQSTLTDLQWRNVELQAAAEVSQAASNILDPDELIQRAVDLIRERFDLYYVGLFLVDERGTWTDEPGRWAVLRAGTGRAGRIQLERGHKLEIGGESMIGWCVSNAEARIALDVGEEAVHFVNPLLPDTRSEMALPLVSRDQVIGAMTIQSSTAAAFSEEDVAVLQTMADQLATAIENARLFEAQQRVRDMLDERIKELDCLNDIGSKIDETPPIPELLTWVADRIPAALQKPEAALTAIEYEGRVYGSAEAARQPKHVVASINVGGEAVGRAILAYTQDRDFTNTESALLGDIVRRIGGYIENQRLIEQIQRRAAQVEWLALIESSLSQASNEQEILSAITMGIDTDHPPERISLQILDTDENDRPSTIYTLASWQEGALVPDDPDLHRRRSVADLPLSSLWIETTHETIFISDVQSDPRLDQEMRKRMNRLGFRAVAFMPLHSGGRWQGLVTLLWSATHAFSSDEQYYLRQSLDSVAAVMASHRSYRVQQEARDESERRTLQLQTAAEVSRAASSILDPEELIQQVVNLVHKRFELYYAGLFLVDETGQWATLQAGTGKAGQSMIAAGHRLEIGGESMIGWCIAHRQARIALDVGEEAVRFDNPHLPDTRSELALPLISRGQAIGAMTIQSTAATAFSDQDVAVLQTMADQVATALENARLLEETRQALEEVQKLHRSYIRESWTEYLDAAQETTVGDYLLEGRQIIPKPDLHLPEMELALRQNRVITANGGQKGDGLPAAQISEDPSQKSPARVIAPISLRGQVIGVLGIEDATGTQEWTEEDIALLEAVTTQLGLAIDNARLTEQTRASLIETETLFETSRSLAAAQEMEEIWHAVVEAARQRRADACALFLFDTLEHKSAQGIILSAGWDRRDPPRMPIGAQLGISDFGMLESLRSDRPFYLTDLKRADDVDENAYALMSDLGFSALLHQPIAVRDRWFGLLTVLYETSHAFTEAETNFYRTLADQAALAIESQLLLAETQRRAEREQLIRQITDKVRATSSLEAILQTTVKELSRAMGLPRVFVRLGTQDELVAASVDEEKDDTDKQVEPGTAGE